MNVTITHSLIQKPLVTRLGFHALALLTKLSNAQIAQQLNKLLFKKTVQQVTINEKVC